MKDTCRIVEVTLDEKISLRSPEVEHEKAIAIADLKGDNFFHPVDAEGKPLFEGPYKLHLRLKDNRLQMEISAGDSQTEIFVPVKAFRSIIRDYFIICDSYYKAVRSGETSRLEAVDMGRRGMHNDGASMLQEMLSSKAELDFETARRLFTLICVLHFRLGVPA
jgi:uncharacterized protein (UPF0262 family)